MEDLKFVKAASNLHDLIAEYRQYRYASAEANYSDGASPDNEDLQHLKNKRKNIEWLSAGFKA